MRGLTLQRLRWSPTFLVSAFLCGLTLLVHQPIRHRSLAIIRFPFTVIRVGVGILVALPHIPSLSQDVVALRAELVQRQLELAQLREALRQTKEAAMFQAVAPGSNGIVAAVLSRSLIPTQQSVLLDKGARDGLTLDSIIMDARGVIGRVVELQVSTCLVMLLTDPESRVAGLVERSREHGLLVGESLGQCQFIYLDVDADIQEGDSIVTAGLGGPFPKGLLLGHVTRVMRDETSGATSAWVKPAARLSRLEEVLCLPALQGSKP